MRGSQVQRRKRLGWRDRRNPDSQEGAEAEKIELTHSTTVSSSEWKTARNADRVHNSGYIVIGNTISGNAADTEDATTPGTAGINVYGVSSIAGTIIAQNTISQEAIDVAVNGPGAVNVQRNTLTSGIGLANLSGGAINADGNWWGCNNNPTFPISGFAGCSGTFGAVTVNVFAAAPIVK